VKKLGERHDGGSGLLDGAGVRWGDGFFGIDYPPGLAEFDGWGRVV
jgi:hypothetical protein